MRIQFIQPPIHLFPNEIYAVLPPLGIAYLAAIAEREGHKVEVLDAIVEGYYKSYNIRIGKEPFIHLGLDWHEIRSRINLFKPDCVGITCPFTMMSPQAHKIAGLVKGYDQDIPVIMGGMHPSVAPSEVLSDHNIDFVVIGEGEKTLAELLRRLEDKSNFSNVLGTGLRVGGKIKISSPRPFIEDLDSLPFPARHLLSMEKYIKIAEPHGVTLRKRYASMITSRGCPGRCTFCAIHCLWGHKWRARSPENVVLEIEQLVEKYHIKEIHFEDDNLTLSKKRMERICDLIIERGVDITWTTPNGVAVHTLDKSLLKKMCDSGCYELYFGIESGNELVLHELIKKPISLETTRKVVKWAKELGIWTHGFFVMGIPGETKKTIWDTINFAKESNLDFANFFIASPYPGTELYRLCVEKGFLPPDFNVNKLRTQSAVISTKEFTAKELLELQRQAFKEFALYQLKKCLNPLSIGKRLLKIRRYEDLMFLFRKAKRLSRIFREGPLCPLI